MMSSLDTPATSRVLEAIGVAVIHFAWQGALVAAVLTLWLRGRSGSEAASRYGACAVAMIVMLTLPVATVALHLAGTARVVAALEWGPAREAAAVSAWVATLAPQAAVLWLAGTLVLHARLALHVLRATLLAHTGATGAPDALVRRVSRVAGMVGVRRAIRVRQSAHALSPMLVGWLRPIVLLPVDAARLLTPRQLDAVLAHELAHVRRHDYAINVLQSVFEALLFFHPAVWWVSHRLRVEREYSCDDVAVRVSGSAIDYARALARLDAQRDVNPALASTGGSLMERITRLVGRSPAAAAAGRHARTRLWSAAAGALALSAVVVAVGCFRAATSTSDDESAPTPAAAATAARFGDASMDVELESGSGRAEVTLDLIDEGENVWFGDDAARDASADVTTELVDAKTGLHETVQLTRGADNEFFFDAQADAERAADLKKRLHEARVRNDGSYEQVMEEMRAQGLHEKRVGDAVVELEETR